MTAIIEPSAKQPARRRRDVATQWQLMWWKLKRNRMALIGLSFVAVLVLISLFAEAISPYRPLSRNPQYLAGEPMVVRLDQITAARMLQSTAQIAAMALRP